MHNYRYLWLELAVTWQGWWNAPPMRRKRPIQPRRLWPLVGLTACWELAILLLAIGAMPNR